jgi:signal transduction histidine kinase
VNASASPLAPRKRILVVEDDHDFADSLKELLEAQGFDVATARSASEALDRLTQFSADLALIDVKLGADDGIALVSKLRSRQEKLVCILMTAYAELNSAIVAVRSGASDYLMKPLQPEALSDKLTRAIDAQDNLLRKEREQRLITIGSVCTGIAHDVNNCLQVMLYEIEGMESSLRGSPPDTGSATASIHTLNQTVEAAAGICQRILEFAKGAGSVGTADAVKVLRVAEPLLQRLNRARADVQVTMLVPDAELWVALGAAQLEQIIVNLVLNACQASGADGQVRVELTTEPGERGRLVTLNVTDNGGGIPEDVMPHIFDPYFSTKAAGEGTGLGLSIVYGLVKSVAGADIRVESRSGLGTRFTVTWPELESA